tara:strand:- start:5836 stop:6057 length:222 start_codon:yes stop_codon:yes gene_type:complete
MRETVSINSQMYLGSVASSALANIFRPSTSCACTVLMTFDISPIQENPFKVWFRYQLVEQTFPDAFSRPLYLL